MCDNVAISFTQPTHTCQDVRAWVRDGPEVPGHPPRRVVGLCLPTLQVRSVYKI